MRFHFSILYVDNAINF
jgi:hypothetical protein